MLGDGFAVVGRSADDLEIGEAAKSVAARLGLSFVDLSSLEVDSSQLDHVLQTHRAALVRPDRYLFGAVDDQTSLDALIQALGERLCLTPA